MIQSISFRVLCENKVLSNVVSVDYTFSQNEIGAATVVVASQHDIVPEQRLIIEAGISQPRRVFTGYIDSYDYDIERNVYVIQARDVLKKALDTFLIQKVMFGVDVEQQKYYYSTYTSAQGGVFTVHEYTSLSALHAAHPETVGNITEQGVKAHAVVQWLLVMCGIDEYTSIRVHDSNFWIGDITPVTFHLTSVYDAIQQIVSLLGWFFYCDSFGVCRFHPRPNRANVVQLPLDMLLHASKTVSNDQLRNYVEVIGSSGISVVERAPSPYLGSTPYRGVLISNEFIDTYDIASFVARRTLHELNRLRWKFQLTTLPFPVSHVTLLSIPSLFGDLIQIESLSASINESSGYTYTIQAIDFIDDIYFEDNQNSLSPDFVVTYLMTIGDPKHICLLDASPSFSLNSNIVNWRWDIFHTSTPTVLSGQQVYSYFDSTQPTTVRLTITDNQNKTAFIERSIAPSGLAGLTPLYRSLYACFGTMAAGSVDGGSTWSTASIPAVFAAVSHLDEIATEEVEPYVLFLTSTNRLYRADASLQTVTLLPPTNVSAVAISYSMPSFAYYASNTTLYQSTDAGLTFSLVMSLPLPIRHIEVDRTNHQLLYVSCYPTSTHPNGALYLVDAAAKTATDLWPSWVVLNDAPKAYVGGVASSDYVVQWITSTSGVYAIVNGQSLALSLPNVAALSPTLHAWNKAHVVFSTGSYGDVLISGNVLQYEHVQTHVPFSFVIRDGSAPNLIYYATASGVEKSLDGHNTILPLYTPTQALHVVYGSLQQTTTVFASGIVAWARRLQPVNIGANDPYDHGTKRFLYVAALGTSSTYTSPSEGWHRVILPDHITDTIVTDCDGDAVYGYCIPATNRSMANKGIYYVHQYQAQPTVPFTFKIPKRVTSSGLGLAIPFFDLYTISSGVKIELSSLSSYHDGQQTHLSAWYRQTYAATSFDTDYATFHHAHAVSASSNWASSLQWQTVAASPPLVENELPASGSSDRSQYHITHVASVYPFTQSTAGAIENADEQILVHIQQPNQTTHAKYNPKQYQLLTKPAPVSYTVMKRLNDDTFWLATQRLSNLTQLELTFDNSWTEGYGIYEWHQFLPFPEVATYEIGIYLFNAPPGSFLNIIQHPTGLTVVPVAPYQWVYLTVPNATGISWHRRDFNYRYRKVSDPFVASYASRRPQSSVLYCATRKQLYRVADYGRGSKEALFTVANPYLPVYSSSGVTGGIKNFSVTYNKQMDSDALCIVLQLSTNPNKGIIVYRYHDADPWKYHAWETEATLGEFYQAWLICS